jgi:tripartite-type tricarboxylate transporter receptor subunit TctC
MPIRGRALLAGLLSVFALAGTAQAQQYPNKPIRMIVSIAAGSVTDVIMRAAAPELQARLSQPFVIENQGGAASILGARACVQAAGDGYNVCIINHSTYSFNPLIFSNLPYNPDDIVPLGRLFLLIEGVFVNSELGVNSIAELEKLAKSKPEGLNFATLGEGSYPELSMKWINNRWGTKIVGIPYRGGGPAAQALAANQVQVTRFGIGNFLGAMEAGKVKALTVSSEKRSPALPNVPTFAEVGWNDFPGQGWWGVSVPKGTPPDAVAKLSAAFQQVFSDPKFMAFLDKQFVLPAATDPAGFVAFLQQDKKNAETLIKIANTRKTEFKQ